MISNLCLCGRCAIAAGLDLEVRKELALGFEELKIYICGNCKIYFFFNGSRWDKSHDLIIIQSYLDYEFKKRGVLIG